eukprot:6426667-Alexandrium_andersonii.AAC.1
MGPMGWTSEVPASRPPPIADLQGVLRQGRGEGHLRRPGAPGGTLADGPGGGIRQVPAHHGLQ